MAHVTTRASQLKMRNDFGALVKLPNRPVRKCEILGRYAEIVGVENHCVKGADGSVLPANNPCKTARSIATEISNEIERNYRKFGIQVATRENVIKKILKIKEEYDKWSKHRVKDKFVMFEEICSFKSPNQPKWVLKEDIDWYHQKLSGGPGCLAAVDLDFERRAAKRQNSGTKTFDSSPKDVTLEPDTDSDNKSSDVDSSNENSFPSCSSSGLTPKMRCTKLDFSTVAQTALRFGISDEATQEILKANAQVLDLPVNLVPSDTTIFRAKKDAIHNARDNVLSKIQGKSLAYAIQFNGKDLFEATLLR